MSEREFVTAQSQERYLACAPRGKLLGISIVSYFSAESVENLLASLEQTCKSTRVSVVVKDNSGASSDVQKEALKKLVDKYSSVSFKIALHNDRTNVGYAKGNNLAVELLLRDAPSLVWILNPDCSVSGSTKDLETLFTSRLTVLATPTLQDGVISNGFSRMNTFTGRSYRSDNSRCGVDFSGVTYSGGHSIIFTPDAWNAVNGFSDEYFLYMEEADLVTRAHNLGIDYGVAGDLLVNHEGGGTTSSRSGKIVTKSTKTFEESTRSRIIYFKKYRKHRLVVLIPMRVLYAAYLYATKRVDSSKAILRGLKRRERDGQLS